MAISRGDAVALAMRLASGESVLDAEGNEASPMINGRVVPRHKRKPPKDFADVPTVEQIMARFTDEPEESGRPLSAFIARQQEANANDSTTKRGDREADTTIRDAMLRALARGADRYRQREPGDDE